MCPRLMGLIGTKVGQEVGRDEHCCCWWWSYSSRPARAKAGNVTWWVRKAGGVLYHNISVPYIFIQAAERDIHNGAGTMKKQLFFFSSQGGE